MDIVIDKVTQSVEKVTVSVELPLFYKIDYGLDAPPVSSYHMLVQDREDRGTRYSITRRCNDWHETDIVWEFHAEDVSVSGVLSRVYPLLQPGTRDYSYVEIPCAEFADIYNEMTTMMQGTALAGI